MLLVLFAKVEQMEELTHNYIARARTIHIEFNIGTEQKLLKIKL